MDIEDSKKNSKTCPNCGFKINLKAEICAACGIHLDFFDEGKSNIDRILIENEEEDRSDLSYQAGKKDKRNQKESIKRYSKLSLGIIIFLFVIGIISISSSIVLGIRKTNQYNKSIAYYEQAKIYFLNNELQKAKEYTELAYDMGFPNDSLDDLWIEIQNKIIFEFYSEEDYLNAYENAKQFLKNEKFDTSIENILCESGINLANEEIINDDSKKAIDIIDDVFYYCKNNTQVINYRDYVYEKRINELIAEKHFFSAWLLERSLVHK